MLICLSCHSDGVEILPSPDKAIDGCPSLAVSSSSCFAFVGDEEWLREGESLTESFSQLLNEHFQDFVVGEHVNKDDLMPGRKELGCQKY